MIKKKWRLEPPFQISGPRWKEATVTRFENSKPQRSPSLLNPPSSLPLLFISSPEGPLQKIPSPILLNTTTNHKSQHPRSHENAQDSQEAQVLAQKKEEEEALSPSPSSSSSPLTFSLLLLLMPLCSTSTALV